MVAVGLPRIVITGTVCVRCDAIEGVRWEHTPHCGNALVGVVASVAVLLSPTKRHFFFSPTP